MHRSGALFDRESISCRGILAALVAHMVASVMFGVPMPNSSSDLTDEVEPALLSQVPKIADQVCDGMLVTSAAVPLKYRDGLGGPRDVVGFIRHTFPSDWPLKDALDRTTQAERPFQAFHLLGSLKLVRHVRCYYNS